MISQKIYLSELHMVPENYAIKITQLQKDGIRFLYKQLKKNKPGVILNDISGCGKRVQIVLFLNCWKDSLTADCPCLIICESTEIPKWKEQFEKWYGNTDDVIFDSGNPFAKKKIFVKSTACVVDFLIMRKWNILVIDHNTCYRDVKFMKQIKLSKSLFKIWVTNINVMKNLEFLKSIYEWINPNDKFDPLEYLPSSQNPREIIEKRIKLENYFEDTVLRRLEPLDVNKIDDISSEAVNSKDLRTRKNKDPTGTKVKSSKKRKIDEDSTVSINKVSEITNLNDFFEIDEVLTNNHTNVPKNKNLSDISEKDEVSNNNDSKISYHKNLSDILCETNEVSTKNVSKASYNQNVSDISEIDEVSTNNDGKVSEVISDMCENSAGEQEILVKNIDCDVIKSSTSHDSVFIRQEKTDPKNEEPTRDDIKTSIMNSKPIEYQEKHDHTELKTKLADSTQSESKTRQIARILSEYF